MSRKSLKATEKSFAHERFVRALVRPRTPRLRVLIATPEPYAVGMGGLNLQAVWETFQATEEVVCERAFSEWPDGRTLLPPLRLTDYDLIGISLPYELDWLALPAMLQAGGLPVWAEHRSDDAPLVIAGGASVTMNPEPLAEIVDAFVIGEAEPVIPSLVRGLLATLSRGERLDYLATLPGVYVPSRPPSAPICRLVWYEATEEPRRSLLVSPRAAFADRFLIEVGRGCPLSCRFCVARCIYGPVRWAQSSKILAVANEGLRVTHKIGLIGAALSAYPNLTAIVEELVREGANVSLSSLRADRLTGELLAILKRGGQDTVTIAPEAGTETLRKAAGKPISDAAFESVLQTAQKTGIKEVKVYFMAGLPNETPADRDAIASLVASWSAQFRRLQFVVTISPFVPKPWTPFEDAPFAPVHEIKNMIDSVVNRLRGCTRVRVRPESARWAGVQAALARGDRAVGRALVTAAMEGTYSAIKKALKAEGKDLDEPLLAPLEAPWRRALAVCQVCR